jgi:hypothetical protein
LERVCVGCKCALGGGPRYLHTFADELSFFVVSLLTFWITAWAPRYWKLIKLLLYQLGIENHRQDADFSITTRTAGEALLEIIRRFLQLLKSNPLTTILALTLCAVTLSAVAAGGASVTFLALDNNALSTSSQCGMHILTAYSGVAQPMGQIMESVESFYSNCYEKELSQQECDVSRTMISMSPPTQVWSVHSMEMFA